MIIFRAWSKDLSKYHKLDDISNDQGLGMFYEVSQRRNKKMTDSILKMVQSIENDYGTDYTLWPENDTRLKKIHEWYINHPDTQKRNLSEIDILRIQELLDKQIQKKKICEMFEISPGKLIRNIEIGILDDTKWKAVGR